jgi:flagellar motor switch/type III secretory pathway protein FliN
VDLARVEHALADIVGARVRVLVRRVDTSAKAAPLQSPVSVSVTHADAAVAVSALRIDVEKALATACVARVLRREPPAIVDDRESPAPLAGAFAAILHAAGRRAHAESPLRVASAGAARGSEGERGSPCPDRMEIAVALTVLLGDDAYLARVAFDAGAVATAPDPVWGVSSLRRMGATPLCLRVVASTFAISAADVGALRPRDIVVLPTRGWRLTRSASGAWHGTVWLATREGSEGIRSELGEHAAVVLRGECDSLGGTDEGAMAESAETSALVEVLGEVPVVVRVEIGEATLAAREWATLSRGDVIALGRRVGDRVVLRVGGVAVARGDLVDVEGEIGVRITERLGEDRTPEE